MALRVRTFCASLYIEDYYWYIMYNIGYYSLRMTFQEGHVIFNASVKCY